MAKIRTLSRHFMANHIRKGEPTYFVEKLIESIGVEHMKSYLEMNPNDSLEQRKEFIGSLNYSTILDPKHHTIRMGRHFNPIDELTLAVWSGKPYRSKQVKLWTGEIRAIDIEIQIVNGHIRIYKIDSDAIREIYLPTLAKNDGLTTRDFIEWFALPEGKHEAQILCWGDAEY